MNIINTDQDPERPEPFSTILELLAEHSEADVLSAISDAAEFESEDEEVPSSQRLKSARLHLELEQLLDRMADFEEVVEGPEAQSEVTDPRGDN
jgi:hypothetical protein